MTINEVARFMNTKKSRVKAKRLMFLRSYYLAMYRVYMVKLFDDCYISDPTVYNEKELFRNIAELNVTDMFGNSGGLRLKYDQVRFAYYKADESKKEFLCNLMNALKYRELGLCIDRVYEECGFRESPTTGIRLNMCLQGAMILAKSGVEFNKAVAECITEFEDEVMTIDLNEYIWCLAMYELGIPREEWQNDGLLDGGLSHYQEVECAKGILNGVFKVSHGKYTDRLLSWLREHPWGERRMSIDNKGLYDYIFMDRFYEINSVVDALTEVILKDEDSSLLGAYGNLIYYKQKRVNFEVPMGLFQVVNELDDERLLPQGTNVLGLTGEFYSIDRLEEDGIEYAGCPIVLECGKETMFVYDREQTNVQFESWYSYNDAMFSFSKEEGDAAPRSQFILGTLQDELYKGYVNSMRSSDCLLSTINVSSLAQFEQAKRDVWKFIEGVKR